MARPFARHPEAVTPAAVLGEQCAFELALIPPRLPPFDVPAGYTEATWLRHLVTTGARERYGPPEQAPRACQLIEHELAIIEDQNFPGYFLIVHDIVWFCRDNDILCQGRGSAANSAVCYALGITAVDAVLTGCCSSGSCHRPGTAIPTSTWTSSPVAVRRSSSTSTSATTARHRPGRQRDHLPAPFGGPRHGPGARILPGPAGRVEQTDQLVERAGRLPGPRRHPGQVRALPTSCCPGTWESTPGAW